MTVSSAAVQVRFPAWHDGQKRVLSERRRFNAAALGRRSGKTALAQYLLAVPAIKHALPTAYFAATYKLLEETWREMESRLTPVLRRVNSTEKRMELVTGGVVDFWTLSDEDAGRSRKYRRVVVDEAGLVPDLGRIWNSAIRPTLADYEGDGYLLGTPKGRNFFWQAHQMGADPLNVEWASWQMPTSCNPHIKPAEIEAMREQMPERLFRQEILAEFLEDGGGVFRFVRESATSEPLVKGEDGHQYAIGCDWGRESDATVFTVIDITERRMVAIDRMLKTDYALQRTRLHAMAAAFPNNTILAESNSIGAPVIEQLVREGLRVVPFSTTNATKAQIVDALALAFEQRTIKILPDPVLIAELEAYESERLISGMLRYSAPEGQHDDCVISCCLAWWQVAGLSGVWSGGSL